MKQSYFSKVQLILILKNIEWMIRCTAPILSPLTFTELWLEDWLHFFA
jgi:hypothetical protein